MATPQPLKKFRILDLSRIWAGPYCTKLLADMGAEVIKMESLRVYDSHRGPVSPAPGIAAYPDADPGAEPWNRNGWFNCLHMSKYGITLELTNESGRRVFEQLVSISDVLIENFRQGSLERLGYTYETLRKYRPDFIIRLKSGGYLVLETKGQDSEQNQTKRRFLDEWVNAVNEHGGFGRWSWDVSRDPGDIKDILARHAQDEAA